MAKTKLVKTHHGGHSMPDKQAYGMMAAARQQGSKNISSAPASKTAPKAIKKVK
jgi:hypothetical protein